MGRKPDELDYYFKRKFPRNYISGDSRCSLLVWGIPTKDGLVPKLCTLTIGADYESSCATKESVRDSVKSIWMNPLSSIKKLYRYGTLIATSSNIEFGIICFSVNDNIFKNNEDITFLTVFSSDSVELNRSAIMNGNELRNKLLSILDLSTDQKGTSKEKNKSTADFFHDWSRENMPASIVKLDVDGILVNFDDDIEKILVEIKRSNIPPIPEWTPYFNDMPDFVLLFRLSSATGSKMWIIHHDGLDRCTDDTVVSLFIVDKITNGELTYSNEYRKIKLGGPGKTVETILRELLKM